MASGNPSRPSPQLAARDLVHGLPASKVREVANAGFGQSGVLRFWFGESDEPTPEFIKAAATAALARDEVFYTHNNGRDDLRQALADYVSGLHGCARGPGEISVTSSGVSALMIAMQALLSPGDRVVVVTPVWPNVTAIPAILSAHVIRVGLRPGAAGWKLDLDELLAAMTPDTRLVILNSPGNPTGWMLTAQEQLAILERARHLGVWILSDDVYERLIYREDMAYAPSFLRLASAEDRLISANSFSKSWLMTGWRLGWLVAPRALETDLGKLIEFNTSCAPAFVQSAGLAALREGEPMIARLRQELHSKRDRLLRQLNAIPGLDCPPPDGGMYVFFRIPGEGESLALAKQLVAEAQLGLAPGVAFGPEGEGWLRWCFAARAADLDAGAERLRNWMATTSASGVL
ncbi:MAG: pyridoxal phosphate-dependent aminotransferase [Alphaproteobacteria bacterium]|nr:pyridoxal phosphate-dependent aminotransferase [Alphaproteobacteria bacterium]